MRFGTRTELGRRWMACGCRPQGEMLIGYEYGYLSAALNARTGELFCLILPDMRTESSQVFINEFMRSVGKDRAVRLITDGAASHRSTRLRIEGRLEIEYLPPYSPQLNPVERLFKELRQQLKNRVFEGIRAVEAAVIEAVKPFLADRSRVKKLTFYGWLYNTPT